MPDYRNKATGARLREDAYARRLAEGDIKAEEWEEAQDAAVPEQIELPHIIEPLPEKPEPATKRRKKR